MSQLLPSISDAQAEALKEGLKLGTTALETLQGAGAATSRAVGPFAADVIAWAFGDALKVARWENACRRMHEAKARLAARGIEPDGIGSPSIIVPLLEGACDESRPELVELWTKLLANALDPSRSARIRRKYIDIVKALDPPDAQVFEEIQKLGAGLQSLDVAVKVACSLCIDIEEVQVSFENLSDLKLICTERAIHQSHGNPMRSYLFEVTPLGRQFWGAIAA